VSQHSSWSPSFADDIFSSETLREVVLTFQGECLQAIVTYLVQAHRSFQDNNVPITMGPFFPKRGQRPLPSKSNIRPNRPQFQMFLHNNQLESTKVLTWIF
jgi:ubiquitin carboxyl-terminal hydrolase 34